MALRDQPYLPLYVKDYLTDEKLILCSPAAHGIYSRLICILHKESAYGKIKLDSEYKKSGDILVDFSEQLSINMPWKSTDILPGLRELLKRDVIQLRGSVLSQKRMVEDNDLSEKRSKAGKTGGKKTVENNKIIASQLAQSKVEANTVNVIAIDNDIEVNEKIGNKTDEEISREKKFCDEILEFFGFNEINHPKNFMAMYHAYHLFDLRGSVDHFITQCRAYKKYIEQTGGAKYKFRFENFLGKPDDGFAGTWNSENWLNKLSEASETPGEKPIVFLDDWSKKFYIEIPIAKRPEYVKHLQGIIGGNIVTTGSGVLPRWNYPSFPVSNQGVVMASFGNIGKEKQAS